MGRNLATSIPLIGGLFDDSADRAQQEIAKNRDLWGNLQTPDLKWQDYNPEAFNPESANASQIKEDPNLVSQQMSALNSLAGLSQNGLSDVDQAGYADARNEAGQIARSGNDAALANAQARGLSGSGLEFAMREGANQNAANMAQKADLQQAADSARQRALYAQAYGSQLAGVRNQNYQTQAANTNALNNFNMANTQARNQAGAQYMNQRNEAQQYNNQGHIDTAQKNFNNQVTKTNGMTGANTQVANGLYGQDAANQADRNMWTGIAANGAMYAMGAPATPKKPGGGSAGGSYGDVGNVA